MSFQSRRIAFAVAVFSVMPLLAACPKKEEPVVDAAPPPPPPEEASTTVLVPLEEDAGEDAGEDADATVKFTGKPVNTNIARLKQCCTKLGQEAKRLGTAPEAGLFTTAAAQCSAMVAQAGPSGNAPELGALKTVLAGRTIPPVCAGF